MGYCEKSTVAFSPIFAIYDPVKERIAGFCSSTH
jgi:hypothetical protein